MSKEATLHIHITNIPCSEDEPFELKINDELVYKSIESIPADKLVLVEPRLLLDDMTEHNFKLTIIIPKRGVDSSLDLNMSKNGNFIHIRMTKSLKEVKVKQQHDDNFVFDNENETEIEQEPEKQQRQKVDVLFYLLNVKASENEKLEIFVNGEKFWERNTEVDKKVLGVKGSFEKPEDGDHIINVDFILPKQGFSSPMSGTFNLSNDGTHILLEVYYSKWRGDIYFKGI